MISGIASRVSLPNGATVLDVGCGTGKYAHMWSDLGYNVVGADLSEVGLMRARRRAPMANFVAADATRLPIATESADMVFSSGLSLFNEPELMKLRALVAGMVDVLKPNGFFAFVKTSMLTGKLARRGSRFDHTLDAVVSMLQADSRLQIMTATNAVPHFFVLRGLAMSKYISAASNLAAKLQVPSRIVVIAQRRS
jgi:ubiquinone/menaquinone biosynthesis C-methylase UbiE